MTWLQNALDRDDTGIGQGMETRHRYVWVQHHQHQSFEWAGWGSEVNQHISIVVAITYSIYTYQLCQAVNQQGQCYFDDKWDPEKGKSQSLFHYDLWHISIPYNFLCSKKPSHCCHSKDTLSFQFLLPANQKPNTSPPSRLDCSLKHTV